MSTAVDEGLLRVAHHEAAHAIACRHYGRTVDRITVAPERGLVEHSGPPPRTDDPKDELEYLFRMLVIKMAGPVQGLLDQNRDPRDVEARVLLGVESSYAEQLNALAEGREVLVDYSDFLTAAEVIFGSSMSAYRWMDVTLPHARSAAALVLRKSQSEIGRLAERLIAEREITDY